MRKATDETLLCYASISAAVGLSIPAIAFTLGVVSLGNDIYVTSIGGRILILALLLITVGTLSGVIGFQLGKRVFGRWLLQAAIWQSCVFGLLTFGLGAFVAAGLQRFDLIACVGGMISALIWAAVPLLIYNKNRDTEGDHPAK